MTNDPNSWTSDFSTLAAGDEFTYEWLDRFRALMTAYNEAVALAERLGEGLSYDSPERRAKDLAAFHEWQFNRAK